MDTVMECQKLFGENNRMKGNKVGLASEVSD